jgi:hypothetical protein
MAKEKWAKAYVKANIRETEKGYHCKMPDLVAYPAGAVTMTIGKPVDQVSARSCWPSCSMSSTWRSPGAPQANLRIR